MFAEENGNVAAVARRAGVSRAAIMKRVDQVPSLKEVLTEARETMLDDAEGVLYRKVLEGSTPELIFFLKTQGRRRGYSERVELTGADGAPIQQEHLFAHDTVAAAIAARSGAYNLPPGADESDRVRAPLGEDVYGGRVRADGG